MAQSIPLIESLDGFQRVRDAVADLLAVETTAQQALAVAGGLDPDLWKFYVYSERVNPWEVFRDGAGDLTPIVNVWYDSSVFDPSASNVSTRQTARPTRINVDIYAYAASAASVGGHSSGDETASKLAQNIMKLCRQILMHDKYKHLGLVGVVGKRWINSMTAFQPASGGQPLNRVAACRIALDVDHNEVIELEDHETLEIIGITMRYEPNGQIIAALEYDFS